MASAVVGALRAVLSADTADFDKAMKGADANIRKLADSMQKQLVPSQSRVNSLVKDFLGSREIGMANAYAKAVEQIGGANKLVASDQAKVNRVVQEALLHYKALGVQAPANLKALANATMGVQRPSDALASSLGKLNSVAGSLGISLGVGAVVAFGKSVVNAAGEILDASQKLGVSTKAIQQWKFAAEQTGASMDDVSRSVVQMNDRLANGNQSTVKALEAVGLKFHEIRAMKSEDAFNAIVDAISKVEDPMTRTRVALDLFGKSGAEILPAIAEGFKKAGDAAPVMADRFIKSLDKAEDSLNAFLSKLKVWAGSFIGATQEINDHIAGQFSELFRLLGKIGTATPGALPKGAAGILPAVPDIKSADVALAEFNKSVGQTGKEQLQAADATLKHAEALKHLEDRYTSYARKRLTGLSDAEQEIRDFDVLFMQQLGLLQQFGWSLGIVNKMSMSSLLGTGVNLAYTPPVPSMSLPMSAQKSRGPMGLAELLSGVTVPGYSTGQLFKQGISGIGGMLPQTILAALQGGGNVKQSIGALIGGNLGTSYGGKWETMFGGGKLGGKLGGAVAGLSGGIASAGLSAVLGNGGGKGMMSNIGSFAAAGMMFGPWGAAVGAGIGAIVGIIKKGANNAKKARQEFAKELGFGDQNGLLDKLRTMGPEGNRLVNTALNVIGKNDTAANKKWMDDVRSFFDRLEKVPGKVNELSQALSRFGGAIPDQLSPLLDSILGNPNLSSDLRMQLEGMRKPSWQAAQEMAQALGVNPAALGAGFNQSRLSEQAFSLKRSLDVFAKFAGSDQNAILKDMADEFSALAADAKRTGAALPRAIQAFLRSVDEMGLLLDENGNRIDASLLTFADIEDEYLAQAVSLLEQIRDLLTPPATGTNPTAPGYTPRLPGVPPPTPGPPGGIVDPSDPAFSMYMPSLSGASYGSAYAADMNGLSATGQSMTVILERDGRAEARWLVPFIPNEVERLRLA